MLDSGIGSWPARRARMTPGARAFVQDESVVTYAEVDRLVEALAHGLRARGVTAGDRVAFLGLNSIELAVTLFAAARLGAIFLPLNTRLAPPELAWILTDAEPALLIHSDAFDEAVSAESVEAVDLPRHRFTEAGGHGLDALAGETAREDRPDRIDVEVGLDDVFMIQYTSGTSGRPKGVMLTHGNIAWNAFNLLVDVDVRSDEIALVTAPLFHTAALNQVLLPTFLKGGTSLIAARFDPAKAIATIERERVTLLFGVTSMYQALAQEPSWKTADLDSLRSALSGGAPIPRTLLDTWQSRGLHIIQGYGLTEASPGTTMLRAGDGLDKLGSAGTPCFFTDVRVVAPDGDEATSGQPGEVHVSGPNVTPGYWHDAASTDAAFDGPWLRTGDVAVADDDGFLYIVDRVKDMFISGGENVFPAEVEQAIYTHPDVVEAAVIGVPDERWGEVGRAVVVRRPDSAIHPDDLLKHLDGRLARYKIPKAVVFVDEIPHNASGKLSKSRVRELYGTPEGS
ncbi:fatty-acyl-CoA synthase [Nocardioides luteus]|uniref:Fatty-acyl-CoA synthase n=1 Tax=Nocardioides luteus TaxID=1844 RepID=A0ABQ5SXI8_9ACTN|nr:long-chain fatty acid--CoA ligase [Nocardioides luteus]MDR7312630.1 fatty-acyl-CoA synthase [Nocardioides luteus]GGR46446.1 fatty-acyl-CoA synthase [Nocardioides luteus]GLJ68878.1 fatty-acyl-CoA synthase [Nocardioides luteus]